MKIKFLIVMFLGISICNGQVKKKVVAKAPLSTKTVLQPKVNINEGIFADFETSKASKYYHVI